MTCGTLHEEAAVRQTHERSVTMKKKEFLAGAALLSISSAVCLKIMKKVGEKLKKEKKRK